MIDVDGFKMIGGPTWNPALGSLRPTEAPHAPVSTPAAEIASTPEDRLDVRTSHEASPAEATRWTGLPCTSSPETPPIAPKTSAAPRAEVPVLLLSEEGTLPPTYPTPSTSPLAALGVLAQLDESPMPAPRSLGGPSAIDGASKNAAYADFGLAGPGNAARYLANPSLLYLG